MLNEEFLYNSQLSLEIWAPATKISISMNNLCIIKSFRVIFHYIHFTRLSLGTIKEVKLMSLVIDLSSTRSV